ncbi:MAG: 16S rRNA (guanine(527)-N(7))-methyltransferase RsmG [Steroidobacteraceae bacterium]
MSGTATAEALALVGDAQRLGVPLDTDGAAALLRLLDELSIWNQAYSLSAISGRDAMIRGHLLDSLSAYGDVAGERIADVGTGAGFPGLPLALVAPARSFTLIDSVAKKIRFVAHATRALGLGNVTALQARVETLRPQAPFDTVIARAYAALPDLLSSVQALAGPATRVVALKGRYPRAELAALPAGWRLEECRPVQVPGLAAERHVLRFACSRSPPTARLIGS